LIEGDILLINRDAFVIMSAVDTISRFPFLAAVFSKRVI